LDENKLARRLLFLGYSMGLHIWDCTNLGTVSEILNLPKPPWGRVAFAGVLHAPPRSEVDPFVAQRPLIGVNVSELVSKLASYFQLSFIEHA
jgi:hypothetical protein